MARPQSTRGGRPVVVSVRLSEEEAVDLDSRRGALKRGDYFRLLLAHDHERHERGDLSVRSNTDDLRALREKRVPTPIDGDPTGPPVPIIVTKHHHRPGELVKSWYEDGIEKRDLRCAEPGCGEVLHR
jgi:hypothetical protein